MQNQFEGLIKALNQSTQYVYYFRQYFCSPVSNQGSENGDIEYEFDPKKAENIQYFYENWPQKRAKIEARLVKNSYFRPAGKYADYKDLAKGKNKYTTLSRFFKLEPQFKKLEEMFPDEMQVIYRGGEEAEAIKQQLIKKIKSLSEESNCKQL